MQFRNGINVCLTGTPDFHDLTSNPVDLTDKKNPGNRQGFFTPDKN
jgi:hypothetical protein